MCLVVNGLAEKSKEFQSGYRNGYFGPCERSGFFFNRDQGKQIGDGDLRSELAHRFIYTFPIMG